MAKQGAGIAFVCGNKMLLLKRSDKVGNPNTWAPPGGHVEKGETPLDTAIREADEEILNVPQRYVITGEYTFLNPKMDYTLFVAHVLKEFRPSLNWEHTDSRWVTIKDLPKFKLHPGFATGLRQIREMSNAVS